MATGVICAPPILQFTLNNGQLAAGGSILTQVGGTNAATYQDQPLTVPLPNPIPLNSRGEISNAAGASCQLFLTPNTVYTFTLFDASGNQLWVATYVNGVQITVTQAGIGALLYPQSNSEGSAGATPTNIYFPYGDSRRFNFDLTGGTNNTTLFNAVLAAAGLAAIATGQVNEVTLWPGTYLINRLYMNYSNVFLKLMPGAVIKQTLTGITNSNTTGTTPAYAIIHINPLTYTVNPSSAVTAINNVKVYGGGTVQGPNTTAPGSYQQFQLGIASNDCNKCWVEGIVIQGCGGENVLHGPSAWNTCSDTRINYCEILQGGEVGINNCRAFEIMRNYVHDSWFQNGVGGDGDQGVVGFNRIRNMAGGGLTPGGSGARDITASRDILFIGNMCTATGLSITGTYAMFCSDDGATTIPKYNHRYIGNTLDAHNGPIAMGCDYNTALNIEIENNTITNCVSPGASGQDFNVIAGSGVYHLRGNTMNPGIIGNNPFGISNSSAGTPVVNIEEGNDISGHSTADINPGSTGIVLKGEFTINTIVLVLTGFAAGLNVPIFVVKKGSVMEINFTGTAGTSNATTMTLGTLPVYLRPTRTQNFRFPVIDNGANLDGLLQIAATGVMTLFKDINGGAFTNTGTKGLVGPYNITCLLT